MKVYGKVYFKKYLVLIFLLFLFSFIYMFLRYSGLFGPTNYNDCILESLKGVQNTFVAREIKRACRNKFPEYE